MSTSVHSSGLSPPELGDRFPIPSLILPSAEMMGDVPAGHPARRIALVMRISNDRCLFLSDRSRETILTRVRNLSTG